MLRSVVRGLLAAATLTNAFELPWSPIPADVLSAEGLPAEPNPIIASSPNGNAPNRAGWVFTTDSEQAGHGRYNAMDGNSNTFWHSMYSPQVHYLPHYMTIDTRQQRYIDGITYRPRQDGNSNGNIGQHKIYTSTDGVNWGNPVAYGTWNDDNTSKVAMWEAIPARYVKIVCITEAGNRGPWSSAAEFYVYASNTYTAPVQGLGLWGQTINFPTVPVAAAVEPDSGNVLTWSSWTSTQFTNGPGGQTLTSTWNFNSQVVSERLVTWTQHDMFCPGISFTAGGVVVITGGNDSRKVSRYVGGTDNWSAGSIMWQGRGYHAQVTMGNGNIFTIGGSWSGGQGGKNGEVYNPNNNIWTQLPGAQVSRMLTGDAQGVYRSDNHGWLFAWKNNIALQAGPSKYMNWYGTTGNGAVVGAGTRGNGVDAMCGNAVMYDATAGKIVTFGGSTSYQGANAVSLAHVLTLGNSNAAVAVENINTLWYARTFHSSVVLPDGQVFITGGQQYGWPFHDDRSVFTPELWNPQTTRFVKMNPNSISRNYHSWSLLLLDGTVMNGGGGLCGTCSTNHMDAQIYQPPYLFNADGTRRNRPAITYVSSRHNQPGATITVRTSYGVSKFSLIRYGSATHTVNTDQRRVNCGVQAQGGNQYRVTLGVNDPGVVVPGFWTLWALDGAGTPSHAWTIVID